MSKPVMIFPYINDDEVRTTSAELATLVRAIRNSVLCEVLGTVTEKLNPGDNSPEKELVLIDVLRSVNDMRTPEPEDVKKGEN